MPRRRRGWINNACYHVTHRCHGKNFLLKFAKHREIYLKYLMEMASRFKIDVLDYMVTGNHVHLLLKARRGENISKGIQFLHGAFANKYNLMKEREGAFWSNRFHSTRIQNGEHLGRCLFYIDMNMVRAGVVKHPAEWQHSAVQEFLGLKKRYRIVNAASLMNCLSIDSEKDFRKWYCATLEEKLKSGSNIREKYWSEAAAVGAPEWLENTAKEIKMKHFKINEFGDGNYLTGRKCQ